MGQCYSVEITLKNFDEQKLIQHTFEQFKDNPVDKTKWFDSIEHIIEFILCKNIPSCYSTPTIEIEPDGSYWASSDFDAAYGWHNSMVDWFEAVAGEGSRMEIYPDAGKSITTVKNGKAKTIWR